MGTTYLTLVSTEWECDWLEEKTGEHWHNHNADRKCPSWYMGIDGTGEDDDECPCTRETDSWWNSRRERRGWSTLHPPQCSTSWIGWNYRDCPSRWDAWGESSVYQWMSSGPSWVTLGSSTFPVLIDLSSIQGKRWIGWN